MPRDLQFRELFTTLDGNDDTEVTDAFDLQGNKNLAVDIAADSGGNATHVCTVQLSFDKTTWQGFTVAKTIAQLGFLDDFTTNAKWVRVRVSTAEGGASSIFVRIHAKP